MNDLLITIIFIIISVVLGYVVGWLSGREQTMEKYRDRLLSIQKELDNIKKLYTNGK